jgi:hypothetical protein
MNGSTNHLHIAGYVRVRPQRDLSAKRHDTASDVAQHSDIAIDCAHLAVNMPAHQNIAAVGRHVATDPGWLVNGDTLTKCDLVLMGALCRVSAADLDQALLKREVVRDADQAREPESGSRSQARQSERWPTQRWNRHGERRQAEQDL